MAKKAKKHINVRLELPPKPRFKVKKLSAKEFAFYTIFSVLVVGFLLTYYLYPPTAPGIPQERVGQVTLIELFNISGIPSPQYVLSQWGNVISGDYVQGLFDQGYLNPASTNYLLPRLQQQLEAFYATQGIDDAFVAKYALTLFSGSDDLHDLPYVGVLPLFDYTSLPVDIQKRISLTEEDKLELSRDIAHSYVLYKEFGESPTQPPRHFMYVLPSGKLSQQYIKKYLPSYPNGLLDIFGLAEFNPQYGTMSEALIKNGFPDWEKIIQLSNVVRTVGSYNTQDLLSLIAEEPITLPPQQLSINSQSSTEIASQYNYAIAWDTGDGITKNTPTGAIIRNRVKKASSSQLKNSKHLTNERNSVMRRSLLGITGRATGQCLDPATVVTQINRGRSYQITGNTILCPETFNIPSPGIPLFEFTVDNAVVYCSKTTPTRRTIIKGDGQGSAFSAVGRSNLGILDCSIEGYETGIDFHQVSGGIINTSITNNSNGVAATSSNIVLESNTINNNTLGLLSTGSHIMVHNTILSFNKIGGLLIGNTGAVLTQNAIRDNYRVTPTGTVNGAGIISVMNPLLIVEKNLFARNGNASLVTAVDLINRVSRNRFISSQQGHVSHDFIHLINNNLFANNTKNGLGLHGLPFGPGGQRVSINLLEKNNFQNNDYATILRGSTLGLMAHNTYAPPSISDLDIIGDTQFNFMYNTTIDHNKIWMSGQDNYLYVYYPIDLTILNNGLPLNYSQVSIKNSAGDDLWAYITLDGKHPRGLDGKWPHLSYWRNSGGRIIDNNPLTLSVRYGQQEDISSFNLYGSLQKTVDLSVGCTQPPMDNKFAFALQVPPVSFNLSMIVPPVYNLSLSSSTTFCPGTYKAIDLGMMGIGKIGLIQTDAPNIEIVCDNTILSGHTDMHINMMGDEIQPGCGLATWDDCFLRPPLPLDFWNLPGGEGLTGLGLVLTEGNAQVRGCTLEGYTVAGLTAAEGISFKDSIFHSNLYGLNADIDTKGLTLDTTVVGSAIPGATPNTIGLFGILEGFTAINSKLNNQREFIIVSGDDKNALINTTYNDVPTSFAIPPPTLFRCTPPCNAVMNVSWYLNTKVEDSDGHAVENADVSIESSLANFEAISAPTGYTGDVLVLEYRRNVTTKLEIATPYEVIAAFAGLEGRQPVTDFMAGSKTVTVRLPGRANTPPTIHILTPQDNTDKQVGVVDFIAEVSDAHDTAQDITVVWEELLPTGFIEFGRGRSISHRFTAAQVGEHLIRATATDTNGASTIDEVVVRITTDNPPTIDITLPLDNAQFYTNTPIKFTARATDTEDGFLRDPIIWKIYDQKNIALAEIPPGGSVVSYAFPRPGLYTIKAKVEDSDGLFAVDQIAVNITTRPIVVPPPANASLPNVTNVSVTPSNAAPSIQITSPVEGRYYYINRTLSFSATVTDAQEEISDDRIVWTTNVSSDRFGTGRGFSKTPNSLTLTTYRISATATDSGGLTATDSMIIHITDNQTLDNTLLSGTGSDGTDDDDDDARRTARQRCVESYGGCPDNVNWTSKPCINNKRTVRCPNLRGDTPYCRAINKTTRYYTQDCVSTPTNPQCNPVARCPTQQMWDDVECINGKKTVYCDTNCRTVQAPFRTMCEVQPPQGEPPVVTPPVQPPQRPPTPPTPPVEQPRFKWWPWIIALVVLLVIAGLLITYVLTKKPKGTAPSVIKGTSTYGTKETDQLDEYVRGALEEGASKDEILKSLVAVGWPKSLVEEVLDQLGATVTKESSDEVAGYIKRSMQQGFTKQQIFDELGNAGWEKKEIEDAFKKM